MIINKSEIEELLGEIEAESEKWKVEAEIEASPLGGNCVKEASYKGMASGLNCAAMMIRQKISTLESNPRKEEDR